jgi:hypothetical protein
VTGGHSTPQNRPTNTVLAQDSAKTLHDAEQSYQIDAAELALENVARLVA